MKRIIITVFPIIFNELRKELVQGNSKEKRHVIVAVILLALSLA